MNNFDAHAILNAAKAGANVSRRDIKAALKATGDTLPGEVPRFVTGDPLPWRGNRKPAKREQQVPAIFKAWGHKA